MSRNRARVLRLPLICGTVIWLVHILKVGLNLPLNRLGIFPREIEGLKGIIFAPMVHADWSHLLANTPPLLVMTFVLSFFYRKVAYQSFILIYLLTGLSVWIFARPNFHIGASGVVYGLVSFVFWLGVFRRSPKSIVIALIILFLYSGMFIGIFPNKPGVSWESHLLGGIVGIVIAFLLRAKKEIDEKERQYDLSETPRKPYFPRDIFEKRKEDR